MRNRLRGYLLTKDNEGCTPLYLAARFNSYTCVQKLMAVAVELDVEKLMTSGNDMQDQDQDQEPAFPLLEKMLTTPHAQSGSLALHSAAWRGDGDVIRALLARKKENFEALSLAVSKAAREADKQTVSESVQMMWHAKLVETVRLLTTEQLRAKDQESVAGLLLLHNPASRTASWRCVHHLN